MLALGHTDNSYGALWRHLGCWRQSHVLCWWQDLSPAQRQSLLRQIKRLDLRLLQHLFRQTAREHAQVLPPAARIRPAPVKQIGASAHSPGPNELATELGNQALRSAEVAVVLAAAGQAIRLGFGPQGTFPIGDSGKSLFQIHAEKILNISRRSGVPLPLCIITSPENDAATRQFFAQHAWFGLDRQQVSYVQQGTMPALDRQTGKLLLAEKHRLATNPNGRGGVLQALASGGRLDDLRQRGIRYLFYCQLDNPLVKVADAEYLGLHIASAAEMSLKVVRKCRLQENLDVLAEVDGKIQLIEHNELPRQLAQRTDARGELEFWAGSIGVHILNVSLLNRLAAGQSVLPYRRVIRKVRYLDESGKLVTPSEPNAMRFKMHIGDALPLARGVLAVETPRGEEFEPPLAPPQKTRPPAYIGMS